MGFNTNHPLASSCVFALGLTDSTTPPVNGKDGASGTLHGSASVVTGDSPFPYCLSLGGGADNVAFTHTTPIDNLGAMSVVVWIKLNSFVSNTHIISKCPSDTSHFGWRLYLTNSGRFALYRGDSVASTYVQGETPDNSLTADGNVHCIAVTSDGSRFADTAHLKYYVDGSSVGNTFTHDNGSTITWNDSDLDLHVGGLQPGDFGIAVSDYGVNAHIERIYLFNRVLSATELALLQANPSSLFEPSMRATEVEVQILSTGAPKMRATQVEVQILSASAIPDQSITGSTGITSGEAFGSGGTCLPWQTLSRTAGIVSGETMGSGGALYHVLEITGSDGIPSGEAFGSGGEVLLPQMIMGSVGIASGETMGSGGKVSNSLVKGLTGIPSGEAFGSGGSISSNTITGVSGIASGEAFGVGGTIGSIGGPLTGVTGIPSGEHFGAAGSVAGPITGTSGIPSSEAFGTTGALVTLIQGAYGQGIPSAEAFGTVGALLKGLQGLVGIPSGEAFGGSGAVLQLDEGAGNFAIYIGGQNYTKYLAANSLRGERQLNFSMSLNMKLNVPDGSGYMPGIGQEVLVFYFDQDLPMIRPGDMQWHRIFGGTVQDRTPTKAHVLNLDAAIDVTCVDYAQSLARRILNMKYKATDYGTLEAIMTDINERLLKPEGLTWVNQETTPVEIGDIEFANVPLNAALTSLAQAAGRNWQVDFWRNVYMLGPVLVSAPFDITEDTTGPNADIWDTLRVRTDRGLYRNRQIMKTNFTQTTTTLEFTYTCPEIHPVPPNEAAIFWYPDGNGDALGFEDTRYSGRINRIISITRNGNPEPFYTLTTGIPGDTSFAPEPTGDWSWVQIAQNSLNMFYNIAKGTVGTGTYPQYGDVMVIKFEIINDLPAPVVEDNAVEIAARQAIEGGTGIYENVQELTDVQDRDLVVAYAQELLTRFSVMGKEVTFNTINYGLEPGQEITVNVPTYDSEVVDSVMNVESLSWVEVSKRILRYAVKVSNQVQQRDALAAFQRLVAKLRRPSKQEEVQLSFDIAKTLPGIVNPGAVTGMSIGNAYVVRKKAITVRDFAIYFKTKPTGADFIMDVRRNGVSIFTTKPRFKFEGDDIQEFSDFTASPITFVENDIITMDIIQVGSIQAGKDGYAALRGWS